MISDVSLFFGADYVRDIFEDDDDDRIDGTADAVTRFAWADEDDFSAAGHDDIDLNDFQPF